MSGGKKGAVFMGEGLRVSLHSKLRSGLFITPFLLATENLASRLYAVHNAFLCPSTVLFFVWQKTLASEQEKFKNKYIYEFSQLPAFE